jgi:formamidopyrimidine-DNA glycosylase
MPELPDVTVYLEALERRVVGRALRSVRVRSPFLVRTYEPPVEEAEGRVCIGVERLGKRIVLEMEGELFLMLHLMIAGRLRWTDRVEKGTGGKIEQARFVFDTGTLTLTEAGTKKRASLHVVRGREGLRAIHRGGVDVLASSVSEFGLALTRENRTVKRALTDPRICDGIGNAYSDEILHAARLSPFRQTGSMIPPEIARLRDACISVLTMWTDRLRREFGLVDPEGVERPGRFPGAGEITAFRPDFAVHGRFGKPCPACGAPVQRIVYAENECNYCPRCQTEGRILADRSMSRLLRDDWPRTLEELEDH